LLDPGVDGAERLRVKLVNAVASLTVLANEMSATEKA
jgi:hypothetical protein